jgi:hypothetical protein
MKPPLKSEANVNLSNFIRHQSDNSQRGQKVVIKYVINNY